MSPLAVVTQKKRCFKTLASVKFLRGNFQNRSHSELAAEVQVEGGFYQRSGTKVILTSSFCSDEPMRFVAVSGEHNDKTRQEIT
jgi:hypothetical protein